MITKEPMEKRGTATREDGSLLEHYESDLYYVDAIRHLGDILQIMVRRHDWQPVSDWRDKQAIKNQIAGPESEAIELYPAESRVVDYANWAHLWLMPGGEAFPFGFSKGNRSSAPQGLGQRGLEERTDTSPLVKVCAILPWMDLGRIGGRVEKVSK
jgi:hypothetical protein